VPVGLEAPLASPVNGMIHGRKWKPHIHCHEAPLLMTRLATAAMVVILYLSGVRPDVASGRVVGVPEPERSRAVFWFGVFAPVLIFRRFRCRLSRTPN
jgi:hypothetical protein